MKALTDKQRKLFDALVQRRVEIVQVWRGCGGWYWMVPGDHDFDRAREFRSSTWDALLKAGYFVDPDDSDWRFTKYRFREDSA